MSNRAFEIDAMSGGLTILHLSDVHRTPDEPVSNQNILDALTADLRRQQEQEGLPKPDFLVISGDLTQAALEDEYNDAYELINRLKDELSFPDFSRVILVPGNHDVNWDISETVFRTSYRKPSKVDDALLHTQGRLHFWTDEKTYAQRLNPFRVLHHDIYGREYGVERREQFEVWPFPDLGVCSVGLNSIAGCSLLSTVWHRKALRTRSTRRIKAQFHKLRQQWLSLAATSTG